MQDRTSFWKFLAMSLASFVVVMFVMSSAVPVSAASGFGGLGSAATAGSAKLLVLSSVAPDNAPDDDNGVVAYWKFDEGSGPTVYDNSGNSNGGTIYGASWVNGISGKALSFDGVNDYVDVTISNPVLPLGDNSHTIEAWIKPVQNDGSRGVLYYGNIYGGAYSGAVRWLYSDWDGDKGVSCGYYGGEVATYNFPTLNSWTHLAWTYDGTTNKLYVNGNLCGTSTFTANTQSSTKLRIGRAINGSIQYFNGIIDEVKIYNRVMSASEVLANYQAIVPPSPPVNNPPTAAFTYSPSSPTTDDTIQFTDQSTDNDGTIVSWYWDFGDGLTGTSQNQTYKYSRAGTYTVTLTVTDNGGLTDNHSGSITVSAPVVRESVNLSVSPSSSTLESGQSTTLVASLSDINHAPLSGKIITWSATAGSFSTTTSTTNSSGQASVTYTAPTIDNQEATVAITVFFAGDNIYNSGYGGLICTIVRAPPDENYPENGLVGCWKFDEGSGTTAKDSSGHGNNGTIYDGWSSVGASWVDGVFGNALNFVGRDARVNVPHDNSLNTVEMTFELWVKPNENSSLLLLSKYPSSTGFYVGKVSNNKWLFLLKGSVVYSTSKITVGEWTHLAGTYDGSFLRIFVNGIEEAAKSATGLFNNNSQPLTIGNNPHKVAWQYNDVIDEVKIYNRAKTAAEILADYQGGAPVTNTPPTASFAYSPTAPTTADVIQFTDLSTDNNGTITFRFWNFGDGGWSTVRNPTHQYSTAGTYTVWLAVDDEDGAMDNCSKIITVRVPAKWEFIETWGATAIVPYKAIIDIKPETLQTGSNGRWITCYIEIPEEDVSRIDVSSVLLEGIISVDSAAPTEIGDCDNDNVLDLMVKFGRASVENVVTPGVVTLTVTGKVGEFPFVGTDSVRVIETGHGAKASAKEKALDHAPEVVEEVHDSNLELTIKAAGNKNIVNPSHEVPLEPIIVDNVDNTVVSSPEIPTVPSDNGEIETTAGCGNPKAADGAGSGSPPMSRTKGEQVSGQTPGLSTYADEEITEVGAPAAVMAPSSVFLILAFVGLIGVSFGMLVLVRASKR